MPRIDEMPQYRARLSRTTHDLSHKFGFTATVAHLLPVFHDFLQAGETIELGFNYNLRTQPLASAAMVDIKSHVEYFFVPAFLLYEPFGQMFYDINDQHSSNFPQPDNVMRLQNDLPVLDFADFLSEMQSNDSLRVGFEEWLCHAYRLFDMLGYNNTHMNQTGVTDNWNPNVFPYPILAYNCIYQYYYRLDSRERFNQHLFNWDQYYMSPVVDRTGSFANLGVDWWDLIRLYYRPKDSDYFTDIKVSPIVDVLNLNVKNALPAANDWLDANSAPTAAALSGNAGIYSVIQQQLAAAGSTGAAQWDVGLGTNSVVVKSADGSYPSGVVDLYSQSGGLNNSAGTEPLQLRTSHTHVLSSASALNTANIRALFATEKLNSITGRARKHYDDQVLAHLGFKVPHDPKHEISCFGHDRGLIHIGEVISTADTANAGLGEIAGKGYGSLQVKPHKFTAPCHGVVMAILSFVPDITYAKTYQKCNAVTGKNDFYQPEYDSLGMQPLFGYESDITDYANRSRIVGWQYRYEQWKRRFNRVSKAFAGVGNLDSWMLDFDAPHAANVANTNNFEEYLHSPSELNQIMLVNYVDSVPGADETHVYDGDPFVIDGFVHCKKVSTMSDFSLPRLDA